MGSRLRALDYLYSTFNPHPPKLRQGASSAKPHILLEVLLFKMKDATTKFIADRKIERLKEQNSLLTALKNANDAFEKSPTLENGQRMDDCNSDLDKYYDRQELIARQKLKAKWVGQGDRPSSWYLNLQRARSAANAIPLLRKPCILLNGQPDNDEKGNQKFTEIKKQSDIMEEIGNN